MKIITYYFITVVCMVFAQGKSLIAQSMSEGKDRLDLTVLWLPQTNWLLNPNDYNAYKEKDYILDYSLSNAGVFFGFYSKSFAGISAGFIYSNQGQIYINRIFDDNDILLEEYTSRIQITYFKFPFLFSYKADPFVKIMKTKEKEKRPHFFFELGPQLSLLQRASYFEREKKQVFSNNQGQDTPYSDFLQDYNIDLVLGIGGNYKISKYLSILFQVRFDYSLNDIENKLAQFNGTNFYPIDRLGTNAATVGMVLGFSYKLYTSR